MTRALWKTKECFAQLLADVSKLELVWDDRVQDPGGSVEVPLAWAGQPILLCMPSVPIFRAPNAGNGQFSMALSPGELVADSDIIMRCLKRLDDTIRRRINDVPELAERADGGRPPYEGVVRGRARDTPRMVVQWRRGGATITNKHGVLLEPHELCVDGEKADVRVVVSHVLIQADGAARVHVAATEIKRTRR